MVFVEKQKIEHNETKMFWKPNSSQQCLSNNNKTATKSHTPSKPNHSVLKIMHLDFLKDITCGKRRWIIYKC